MKFIEILKELKSLEINYIISHGKSTKNKYTFVNKQNDSESSEENLDSIPVYQQNYGKRIKCEGRWLISNDYQNYLKEQILFKLIEMKELNFIEELFMNKRWRKSILKNKFRMACERLANDLIDRKFLIETQFQSKTMTITIKEFDLDVSLTELTSVLKIINQTDIDITSDLINLTTELKNSIIRYRNFKK